jgi:hypothetical protein
MVDGRARDPHHPGRRDHLRHQPRLDLKRIAENVQLIVGPQASELNIWWKPLVVSDVSRS